MDLSKILKGREGCELWSPMIGDCVFTRILRNNIEIENIVTEDVVYLNEEGKYCNGGEVMIFPSENQRDWTKFRGGNIKEGDPVMVSSDGLIWTLAFFYEKNEDRKLCLDVPNAENAEAWLYVVPFADFDPNNLESNKAKSI